MACGIIFVGTIPGNTAFIVIVSFYVSREQFDYESESGGYSYYFQNRCHAAHKV
jgi:hypothetical protein